MTLVAPPPPALQTREETASTKELRASVAATSNRRHSKKSIAQHPPLNTWRPGMRSSGALNAGQLVTTV